MEHTPLQIVEEQAVMGIPGAALRVVIALRRMRAACEKMRASNYGDIGALERELAAIEAEHEPLPQGEGPSIELESTIAGVSCRVLELAVDDAQETRVTWHDARWVISRQHGMSAYPAYWNWIEQRWHQTRFAESIPHGVSLGREDVMQQLRLAMAKAAW